MTARALMVQGTASSAGKSILVTALCRIFRQDGYKVAPFKSQNMALNSFVTSSSGEIGRSQAVQAWASGIEPTVDMNPVLLKPQADNCSQLIVRGKATGTADANNYYRNNKRLLPLIKESYESLAAQYDMIVIEGAGSPAEINLMSREIANMRIAEMAGAPVLLVGDIDRGGVFASLAGTMLLLPPRWRKLVKAFVINKFRGDVTLLKPALDFLEKRYRRPVLGVIPYFRELRIAQEDSVYLDERPNGKNEGLPDVCIIRLPRISNYDDFDPLEQSCNVRYVASADEIGEPDLIILPGTKSTMADIDFLRQSGLAKAISARAGAGTPVIGICGGYQMLGKTIHDAGHAESGSHQCRGLGLLDVETVFEPIKTTRQVKAVAKAGPGLMKGMENINVTGYEIHMGRDSKIQGSPAFNIIKSGNSSVSDGCMNKKGTVFGTYIHGLFDNAAFTGKLIENICSMRGLPEVRHEAIDREKSYDELAAIVRESLDMDKIYDIIAGGRDGRE
jgi:adenosylcobyric acid synthase